MHYIPYFAADAKSKENPVEFMSGFNKVYRHRNPVKTRLEGIESIERECNTSGWTFTFPNCTAARNIPAIRNAFNDAVNSYMNNSMEWKSFVESKNKTFDLIQIPGVSETSIPPIPDAAILFRCS